MFLVEMDYLENPCTMLVILYLNLQRMLFLDFILVLLASNCFNAYFTYRSISRFEA